MFFRANSQTDGRTDGRTDGQRHTIIWSKDGRIKIVDHSDVVEAVPLDAAPTTYIWIQCIGQSQLQDEMRNI